MLFSDSRSEPKIRWKHAHHLKAAAVDDKFAADQSWVRSKPAPPESMAEHYHVVAARLVFLGKENTAQLGLDAQHGEETRGDRGSFHALRQAAGGDIKAVAGDGGDVREALVQLEEIRKLRRGNPVLIVRQPDAHKLRPKLHQMAGMVIRKRTQQHRVHHAEDGSVGADPKREREYGDRRESRRFAQEPERKPQVLHESGHPFPPDRPAALGRRSLSNDNSLRPRRLPGGNPALGPHSKVTSCIATPD